MRGYEISEEEYERIVAAEKECKDKRTSKKLSILMMRYKRISVAKIAEQINCSESKVRRALAEYRKDGLEEFVRNKYKGNHRSLSEAEEKEILSRFEEKGKAGQVITGQEIKKAFDERIGKDTGRGYIYMVLKRHGWRKVMPRAKHPKKADEEAIKASKKLTTL